MEKYGSSEAVGIMPVCFMAGILKGDRRKMEAVLKGNRAVKVSAETKAAVFLGALLIVVSSAPVFSPYLYYAHDLNFHVCRIEAVKHALLAGGGNFQSVFRDFGVTVMAMHPLFFMGISFYIFRPF